MIALLAGVSRVWAADTVLTNLNVPNGTTYTVGAGDTLSVGSGSNNYVGIANAAGWTGALDVSAATSFTANVGTFLVGLKENASGTLRLGVNNTITAATTFDIGVSTWDGSSGTASTAASGTTTIHTPLFRVGWAESNGTSFGTGRFTLGSGALLLLDGTSNGRTELVIGYNLQQYGRTGSGNMDLSGGTADLKLKSLVLSANFGNSSDPGTLTFSASASNRLDVSGTGSVVRVGYLGTLGSNASGNSNGTLDIGNLGSNSAITSTDNSTAILVGYRVPGATGSATGTVKLGGGTLTITTTGAAIASGGGGTSNLSLDGTTLVAGASSAAWITGLSSAKVRAGGVTFNTNGYDIGVPQALLTDATSTGGGLTKSGGGTLTLTGANTFTGPTAVTGGRLAVTSSGSLASSSVTIGSGAELYYRASAALGTAPVFTGTGGTLNASGTVSGSLNVTANNALTVGSTPLTVTGLTLGDNTMVSVESGGTSRVQINGDYTDSLGAHSLVTGFAASGTPYTFFSWTGSSGSLANGLQSNWGVQEGDTVTKKWTQASSGSWNTASAWDGFAGGVTADTTAKTLSYALTYVASGTKAPASGNDVVIDPAQAGITVSGPVPSAIVRSLQVGGTNGTSPTLALASGNLTVSQSVTVTGNGTLDASNSGLIAPTLAVNAANAAATLASAAGSVTTANVSAGSLTVSAGAVTTANVSGGQLTANGGTVSTANVSAGSLTVNAGPVTTANVSGGQLTANGGAVSTVNLTGVGSLAGTLTVPQVNVTAGTPTFSGRAANMTVSGGSVTASGGTIGSLNLPTGSTGTFVVGGGGATVAKADFTAGAGTVNAAVPLTVSGTYKQGTVTITAGAAPFQVGGSNLVTGVSTVVLQGGTTRIDQVGDVYVAGLDVRGWQGVAGQIDGSLFNITVANPAGSSNNSTYNGTIGYATQSIDMSGNDQEHFGTNAGSGVPNSAPRPSGYANNYTVEYRGLLSIPTTGTYRFATTSDDGSALWIDVGDIATANPNYSTANVQNSNYQGMTIKWSNQLNLAAGYHSFIVRFYEGTGGNGLKVQWDPTGGQNAVAIPGTNYYHGGPVAQTINLPTTDVSVTADSSLELNYADTATLGDVSVTAGNVRFRTATAVSLNNIFSPGSGSIAADGPISLRSGTVNVSAGQTLTMNAPLVNGTAASALLKSGPGTLVLSASSSFTGGTEVNAGVVMLGHASALGSTGTIAFGGGSLQYGSGVTTDLSGRFSTAPGQAYSFNTNGQNLSLANSLTSVGGSLSKLGAGRLTLSGSNTFSGPTTISGGTLALASGASLASSYIKAGATAGGGGTFDVTDLSGGLLLASGQKLGGHGTVLGNVVVGAGSFIAPGGSIGTLTQTGTQTWVSAGTYTFEVTNAGGAAGTGWDLLNVDALQITASAGVGDQFVIDLQSLTTGTDMTAGAMTGGNWNQNTSYQWKFVVANAPISSFDAAWFNVDTTNFQNTFNAGGFSVARGDQVGGTTSELYLIYAAVPEPGTLALAAVGLAGIGLATRRRRLRRVFGAASRPPALA